ncbi:hypothetical protein GIB67_025563, partial [Kingdonia uniflora]
SFEISDTLRTRVNMFNVDFNAQCVSIQDEDRQRNDIGGVRLQMGQHFLGQMDDFFDYCTSHDNARSFTYQEFPYQHTLLKDNKVWTSCSPRNKFAIGRLFYASPKSGERYYLKLLLTVVKGLTSFKSLCAVNNMVYERHIKFLKKEYEAYQIFSKLARGQLQC